MTITKQIKRPTLNAGESVLARIDKKGNLHYIVQPAAISKQPASQVNQI
jgi:hypothetical protein